MFPSEIFSLESLNSLTRPGEVKHANTSRHAMPDMRERRNKEGKGKHYTLHPSWMDRANKGYSF